MHGLQSRACWIVSHWMKQMKFICLLFEKSTLNRIKFPILDPILEKKEGRRRVANQRRQNRAWSVQSKKRALRSNRVLDTKILVLFGGHNKAGWKTKELNFYHDTFSFKFPSLSMKQILGRTRTSFRCSLQNPVSEPRKMKLLSFFKYLNLVLTLHYRSCLSAC